LIYKVPAQRNTTKRNNQTEGEEKELLAEKEGGGVMGIDPGREKKKVERGVRTLSRDSMNEKRAFPS